MRTTNFVAYLFLALTLPVFVASLAARNNNGTCQQDCPPTCVQFCSPCPRTNNKGQNLRVEENGGHYRRCGYKDADCHYWPSDYTGPPGEPDTLALSFPVDACPSKLGERVCSDPLPVIPPLTLTTRCPDTNQAIYHDQLLDEIQGGAYVQCHYSSSECYYDRASGALIDGLSIPKADAYLAAACRANLVDEHGQIVH